MSARSENKNSSPVKSGWKTTEFLMTLICSGLGIALSLGVDPDGSGTWDKIVGAAIIVVTTLGYQVSRASVKSGVEGK